MATKPKSFDIKPTDPIDQPHISYDTKAGVNSSMGFGPQTDTTYDPRFQVTSKTPYLGEIVTRSLAWDYYRVQLALPNSSDILQKLGKNIEEIDQLLCDARVKAALNNRRSGTLSLKWTIDQGESPSRMFKNVEKIFEQLDIYNIMSEMLMAPLYGYNVTEVIWEEKDGLILPISLQGKAQRWFVYSDKNELRTKTKMEQVQGERLPPRKFLVTRYHPRYDDPYAGREALFNGIYWPVRFRHLILQYAMQFAEKYGTPWIDITMEGGLQQERLQEIVDVVKNTYQDGIIAHPENTKVTAIDIGDAKSMDNYTELLDIMNREIDMCILGTNLTTEVKGGSFAAANAHMGVRDDIIQEDSRMIEEAMNELISWIGWYNYPSNYELPQFRLYKNEPPTKERAEVDLMLNKMGVVFAKNYYQRSYGLNGDEFEIGQVRPELGNAISTPPNTLTGSTDVVDASKTGAPQQGGANATTIVDSGIESKDQSSNSPSDEAVVRMQNKGYNFSENGAYMLFLRHGSTGFNSKGDRIRSWLNVPLDSQGVAEANKAGDDIAKEGHKIDVIVSSDLDRTLDTSRIVATKLGNPEIVSTRNLRPWNLGKFVGQHSAEVAPMIRHYIDNPDECVPEGEPFNTFKQRYLNEIENIKRTYLDKKVLIVSHHRGDRLISSWQAKGAKPDHETDPAVMAKHTGVKPGGHREIRF